ncbi:MAG: biopolymer transport protein ExbB/TolQ [Verrucomicrobiales bacterium]|jgi:biopolymer transport protein ExbB/TolQ
MSTTPPKPSDGKSPKIRFWTRAIWLSAALIVIPLIFGVMGTVRGMLGAFSELSEHGGAASDALAEDIALATISTAIGLGFAAIGVICLIISVIKLLAAKK